MRVFVSTGERSGDQNAAFAVRRLKERFSDLEFAGMGGENLKAAGVELVANPSEISVIGLQEAIRKLKYINEIKSKVLKEALRSDVFLAVDFPGFNLPLALQLKKYGKKALYYIAPQVWAWGKWRVRHLARLDGVMVVLPFEEPFLRSYGINAHFVGHPAAFVKVEATLKGNDVTVGFLPGSRKDEVRRLLPRMIRIASEIRRLDPKIRLLFSLPEKRDIGIEGAEVVVGRGREVIASSDAVVLASGTATLEAAVEGKPAVVLYALSELSWWMARLLVKSRYISLPNIILNDRLYPEYVQHIHPKKIAEDILRMLERKDTIKEKLKTVKELLKVDRIADTFDLLIQG